MSGDGFLRAARGSWEDYENKTSRNLMLGFQSPVSNLQLPGTTETRVRVGRQARAWPWPEALMGATSILIPMGMTRQHMYK